MFSTIAVPAAGLSTAEELSGPIIIRRKAFEARVASRQDFITVGITSR